MNHLPSNRRGILYLKIIVNLLLVLSAVLFVIFAVTKLLGFFMPFVIGWIVSVLANPLVKVLEKRVKIVRKHSSALIIILVILAIVGLLYLLILVLIREGRELSDNMPMILAEMETRFEKISERIKDISGALPVSVRDKVNEFISGISGSITDFDVQEKSWFTIGTAGIFAKEVAEIFLNVIVSILSAYFFIAKREELLSRLKKMIPQEVNDGWMLIYHNFMLAVGGYFKAQFKIMFIITAILFIGFEILGVGYSLLLALGIAFLDFLPVFGTGAVLWPWAAWDMFYGNYVRAIALIVIYLICQVVKQILQPKMVGDSIGINPLATLLFLYIGYRFHGVIGMILGVPVGMVIVNLYRMGIFNRVIRGFKLIAHDLNEFRKY